MKDNDLNTDTKCARALDELNERLGDGGFEAQGLEELVLQHQSCEQSLREAYQLWIDLEQLEVPPVPEDSNIRFLAMLDEFNERQNTGNRRLSSISITVFKWAAVFIIGLVAGVLFSKQDGSDGPKGGVMISDQLYTSLEAGNPASEKLKVLQTIKLNSDPEEYVYQALYQTILSDPNVNVRLSAIEAMLHFSDKPKVRMLLIKALTYQESAIVQLSLAEVIIKLQENGSDEEIKQLLESEQLDLEVKMHIKETLSQI